MLKVDYIAFIRMWWEENLKIQPKKLYKEMYITAVQPSETPLMKSQECIALETVLVKQVSGQTQ